MLSNKNELLISRTYEMSIIIKSTNSIEKTQPICNEQNIYIIHAVLSLHVGRVKYKNSCNNISLRRQPNGIPPLRTCTVRQRPKELMYYAIKEMRQMSSFV